MRLDRSSLLRVRAALVRFSAVSLFLIAIPAMAAAQMTVSGRVTVAGQALEGATVGIPSLDIETRTTSDGRYHFLIRAAQVRGQVVTLTARHRRFGAQSVALQLGGGSTTQDFALGGGRPIESPTRRDPDTTRQAIPSAVPRPAAREDVRLGVPARRMLDSTAFADASGPIDFASALAGRIPGLVVTSASVLGGSAPMFVRGSRSVVGSAHPLVVVDGVPLDNLGFASAAQQVGLGGLDYGAPLQDLPLDAIATVALLDPVVATLRYGSRAANGVLVVTTKQGVAGSGLQFSARQRYTMESATRLPDYQNRYGQGLGGQFEFFDGMGGGINDAAEQSWGPPWTANPSLRRVSPSRAEPKCAIGSRILPVFAITSIQVAHMKRAFPSAQRAKRAPSAWESTPEPRMD